MAPPALCSFERPHRRFIFSCAFIRSSIYLINNVLPLPQGIHTGKAFIYFIIHVTFFAAAYSCQQVFHGKLRPAPEQIAFRLSVGFFNLPDKPVNPNIAFSFFGCNAAVLIQLMQESGKLFTFLHKRAALLR